MKYRSLYLASLFLIPVFSLAQWSNVPSANTTLIDSAGWHIVTKIVTDPEGYSYICWFETTPSGLNFNVYLQRFDKQGVRQWPANLLISDNPTDTWVTDYGMILDDQGNAVIVNQDYRSGFSNVYAWKISPAGVFLWGQQGIPVTSDAGGFLHVSPKIVQLESGSFVVLWGMDPDNPSPSNTSYLGLQRLSANGDLLWENSLVIKDTTYQYLPDIVAAEDGNFFVGWDRSQAIQQDTTLGHMNYLHIFIQKYDTGGNALWQFPVQVDSGKYLPVEENIKPFLKKDYNGGAFVIWKSTHAFSTTIKAQHFDGNGSNTWPGNGIEVSADTINSRDVGDMVYNPSANELFIAWCEYHFDDVNQLDCWGIYGQRISAQGNRLWGETGFPVIPLICSEDTAFGNPVAQAAPSNDLILFCPKDYLTINNQDTLISTNLYACRVTAQGTYRWSRKIIDVSTTLTEKEFLVAGDSAQGQYVIAWSYWRDYETRSGIAAQNVQLNGILGPLSVDEYPGALNEPGLSVFPSPVEKDATVFFRINKETHVNLSLYDMNGRMVRTILDRDVPAGEHTVPFKRMDECPGLYLLKAEAGPDESTLKILFE